MATITYTNLTHIVGDTSMAATTAEEIIDQGINEINIYLLKHGHQISNMTGTAGSKSWTGTSEEQGAILAVAMEYYQYYKTSGASAMSVNVSGLGYSSSTSTGGGTGRIHEVAEKFADKLMETEVSVG